MHKDVPSGNRTGSFQYILLSVDSLYPVICSRQLLNGDHRAGFLQTGNSHKDLYQDSKGAAETTGIFFLAILFIGCVSKK